MTFSEACNELAAIIQGKTNRPVEESGLMIAIFVEACEEGETPLMSLALAKRMEVVSDSLLRGE